ncbi:hypothetical protein QP185_21570 [Sphingomonas aerolata]
MLAGSDLDRERAGTCGGRLRHSFGATLVSSTPAGKGEFPGRKGAACIGTRHVPASVDARSNR